MKFNYKYMFIFLTLLIIEVFIALFENDTFIRPYIGDILVVILMYSFIKTFIKKSIRFLPVYLFIFASIVELAQYYRIVDMLHLKNYKLISIVIGSTYDIKDIICYLIATVLLIMWQNIDTNYNSK